ncbi:uncharacterized protein LOC112555366 [Pomacea canaliculata]|uniref:uncharacterized protein LOC112555366 n=1 Tax=Pomacea canaliculata TaxID=400727 RepID=UPI000D73B65A|nr:uncharacterized protein LOC112555366 [Pomacea canaliculata]
MTASLIFLLLLMLGKMLDVVFPETCNSTGWFGPQCVFKCHCQTDKGEQTSCNLTSGTCYTGDRCEDGFSGTACQYTDYAFGRNTFVDTDCITNENGSVVVDGHVDTCFEARGKDGSNCSWFVNISAPSLVTQIIVKVPSDTPDNTSWRVLVHKDNTSGEVTLQSFTDKGITLAYVLPRPMSVSRVQVLAPSTQQLRLCEVNVVGGRNTALKKNVSQGEETFNDTSGAEKAVDDERKRSYKDQCAVMKARNDDGQSLSAWWQVVLGPNVLVWSVEMHTNASLKGLDVEMELKLSNGSSMDLQSDEPRVGMALASIPRPVPATELHIRKKQKGDYLILCEVRVLGDCMDGYYGWLCDRRCSCSNTEAACDKMWGSCPSSVMGETGWSTVGYRGLFV